MSKPKAAPSEFPMRCPVCTAVAMRESLMKANPYVYRMNCLRCGHVLDGPVDFDYDQARAGLREAYTRSLDKKRAPIKYDDSGII